MRRTLLSSARPALSLAALVLVGGLAGAQTSSPNPGTTSGANPPYWGTTPNSFGAASVPRMRGGIGYSSQSPSAFSSGSSLNPLDFGLGGLAGRSYVPRPGRYSLPRQYSSSLIGYYSPSALEEAATLYSRNPSPKSDNTAQITLQVPAGAEVWFNGDRTNQTGMVRQFSSPPLTPGKNFTYKVRVRWEKDGKAVEQTRLVKVHANAHVNLDLTRLPGAAKSSSSETIK